METLCQNGWSVSSHKNVKKMLMIKQVKIIECIEMPCGSVPVTRCPMYDAVMSKQKG